MNSIGSDPVSELSDRDVQVSAQAYPPATAGRPA
jgi:hypothetical protein